MAIGINDFDDSIDGDDVLDNEVNDNTPQDPTPPTQDPDEPTPTGDEPPTQGEGDPEGQTEDDLITALLKQRGIDPAKIKFENENEEIEEMTWDSLSLEDKLNILNTSNESDPAEGLDDSEIELINAIRESNLTPSEYLQYMQQSSIEAYLQNVQSQNQVYNVDQYSDDELYVMDLITQSTEITEEEAMEALERAKSNEALFKKQIGALRNAYKREEEEQAQYARLRQEQEAQAQFKQFAEQVEDAIINFESPAEGDLQMEQEDMDKLYTFIVGSDKAGNNWFQKAIQDPKIRVQMAWYYLNGEQVINDIQDYYKKQITEVRKNSYNEGLKAAGKKDKPKVVYNPKGNTVSQNDAIDLDDEF